MLRPSHVVMVPGAHALAFSHPSLVAALVQAHEHGQPLQQTDGPLREVELLPVPGGGGRRVGSTAQ